MNQQPDKLFQHKLRNYQKTAPASAWDKISAAQASKKHPAVWLKIAASLLLIGAAGATWFLTRPDTATHSLSEKNQHPYSETTPPSDSSEQRSLPDAGSSISGSSLADERPLQKPAESSNKSGTHDDHKTEKINSRSGRENAVASTQHAGSSEAVKHNDIATRMPESGNAGIEVASTLNETSANDAISNDEVTSTAKSSSIAATGVTLSYSVEDVSAYLEKNISDEATEEDKKQSTLKKLLQKANDLKTNQDPVGELRQRKNEILALNFINDKRGQKTRN